MTTFSDKNGHANLLNEVKGIQSANYKLRSLVWVNFPLAYTQLVLIVSWTLYALLLLGSQYINPKCKYPLETIGFFEMDKNRTMCVDVDAPDDTKNRTIAPGDPSTDGEGIDKLRSMIPKAKSFQQLWNPNQRPICTKDLDS